MKINAMLLKDFYKAVHVDMLPKGMTKSVSYFTPRMTRIKQWDKVVMFGLQMFCKTWLIDYFNNHFFNCDKDEVINDYKKYMDWTLGLNVANLKVIEDLYDLGYLPIEICALPEGTLVPIHVPMFSITNTHKEFAWLPQALESLISAEMWYPMITATVGHTYRKIVNKYYALSCDDDVIRSRALGNFDFRGDMCVDASLKAGAGWLLSFVNTATVPVIPFMEEMYNCSCTSMEEEVGFGAISTEHFVMCSNYAVDGDERTFLKKMLTDIYFNASFSAVCDSYDYWNVVNNIIPSLHEEIMNHNGCFLVRGDSGDCVEVVTKTVFKLWDEFGGTINSKGYKVLDPHVKAIYGDSITIQRCEEIYKILIENGFAAQNVALGVGSFSMHCIEEDNILKPFTRDTFGMAIKACYAEINGKEIPIFKDPKTDKDTGNGFKKSQKGMCYVYKENEELKYKDGYVRSNIPKNNLLVPVFRNGEMVKETKLSEIRNRLNGGNF